MNLNRPPSFLPAGSLIYAYLRYSSDNQSIESQERALRAWCDENKIILARTFKDEAKSGATVAGREDFLKLFHTVIDPTLTPKPASVLIWSWSRFSREVADAEYYKARIRYEARVQVWSLTDNIPEGKFAPVFEAFQHIQDQDARTRLITDTTRGLHDLAAQGYSSGGFPPIGYKRGESVVIGKKKNGETRYAHKWEFDPNVYGRVKLAWHMRLDGKSFWEIHAATKLCANARGYTYIFRRVTYAGAIQCGSTITWDAHPAYVTRAEWERVQAMHQTRKVQCANRESHPARRRADSPYLVSGKLRCGYCGWAMVGSLYRNVPYYRCDWRHRQGHSRVNCQQPSIVAHAVHAHILEAIATKILTYAELVNTRDAMNAALSGSANLLHERRAFLIAEQTRVNVAIGNLVASLEKFGPVGEISDRLAARRAELVDNQIELAEIDSRIANGEIRVGDDVLHLLAEEMQEELRKGDVHQVKAIVNQTIQQTTLYLNRIQIHYSALPILESFAVQTKESAAYATLPIALGIVTNPQTRNKSVPLTGFEPVF